VKRKLITHAIILVLSCAAAAANAQQNNCLPTPVAPTAANNIFNEEQEHFLGEAIAARIQKDYAIIEDKALIGYLNAMGDRLLKHLPLKQTRLQFFLVDLSDANAFVLPGGRIYVSRKLVALAQNEDELASVISHELGHLAAHDTAIEVTRQFREVLGVTAVTDRRDIFERYNQLIDNVMRKRAAFKERDREKGQLVADQIGFNSLVNAGYDPKAAARFWDRVTETKGKTGSWFSDLFGTTRPEQRRLREMLTALSSLPAGCVQDRTAVTTPEFKQWQASVVAYTGSGRNESLPHLVAKVELTPPLRSDITHIKFSPDGKHVLVQDESSINVLTREPFVPIFHIEAAEANNAHFTPDSQSIVFSTSNMRVEKWSLAEKKMTDVREIVVNKGCFQTKLSPDGQFIACVTPKFDLRLIDVSSGRVVFEKKEFFTPNHQEFVELMEGVMLRFDATDLGIALLNMGFSPSGRYFAAGYYQRGIGGGETSLVLELPGFTKVSLPEPVKSVIANGFTFVSDDRLVGINRKDTQKSPMITFPEGKVLNEYELWRRNMVPAAHGEYLIIRPMRNYASGVLDLKKKSIVKLNERSALDIHGDVIAVEMRNGEVGLYQIEGNKVLTTAPLPPSSLSGLVVSDFSVKGDYIVLSNKSRGGVWDVRTGEAVTSLRGFNGGYVSADGFLYADFPKFQNAERNVIKLNLANGEITPGSKLEYPKTNLIGPYVIVIKSAKLSAFLNFGNDVIVDVFDATTMKLLWSKPYPKEAPHAWIDYRKHTASLAWNITDETVRDEIASDPVLSQKVTRVKEKEGDYLVKVLNMRDGSELGKLLIETGKGSFQLHQVYTADDLVLVADSENRILLYSLKTGEQKGRVFGDYATVSPSGKLLCVTNENGKLDIYKLADMQRVEQFVFTGSVTLVEFSEDGKKLLVLTSNQTVHVFDISSL
jgi:WD40 repeat protein